MVVKQFLRMRVCACISGILCVCVCTCTYIHDFVLQGRQTANGSSILPGGFLWLVCLLSAGSSHTSHPSPAAWPPPLLSLHTGMHTHTDTHTYTRTHKLTIVSVCIVMLYGHKSLEVEGAEEWGHQRVDQWG